MTKLTKIDTDVSAELNTIEGLNSHILNDKDTFLYKTGWTVGWTIRKLVDGRFESTSYDDILGNHDTIEEAVKEIEDRIASN